MEHEVATTAHEAAPEIWYHSPEVWITLAFAIFVALAVKYLVPFINKYLDGRADGIRQQLEQAQRLREEAEALLASYREQEKTMLKEAEALLASAKADAADMRTRAADELKSALDRRTQQAQEKIARAESDAVAAIRTQIVNGATEAARELVTQQLQGNAEDPGIARALAAIERQIH